MEELLMSLLIVIGGFTENLKNPPKDLSSLVSPKVILQNWDIAMDEDTLIAILDVKLDQKEKITKDDIEQAVVDLGNAKAEKRHSASVLLKKAGFAAVPFLEKAIESKDPEVRLTAKDILTDINRKEKVEQKSKKLYGEQLMAILALEKMKSKKSLTVLKKFASCNVPRSLVDSANNAICIIEGKQPKLPDIDEIVKDLANRFPENVSSAGIMRLDNKRPPLEVIKYLKEKKKDKTSIMKMIPPDFLEDIEDALPDCVSELLLFTGNLRIDAIAAMISKDLGQNRDSGYLGFVFKGLCEPSMFEAALASDFRKSFEFKNKKVYFSHDIAICLLDSKTLIIAIGEDNNGQHILPLLKSFSSKKKQFSEKGFAEQFPKIAPGLKDVLAGKAIIGIGGNASENQKAIATEELANEIAYCKRRLKNRPSAETRMELEFCKTASSILQAKQCAGKIAKDGLIEIKVTCENKKDAEELTKSAKEMEKAFRETIQEMQNHRRNSEMDFDADMLKKPLCKIENKENIVKLNGNTEGPVLNILIMILIMEGF